jgi:DNA-binding NarL/FixJ family response regulator
VLGILRVLIVEDFEPFRRFLRLTLQSRPEFVVAGEALDGLEALQKSKDLQPDLILIDVGLPKLNGLAAAEQIRVLAPQAKLLFITLESSSAAVQQAFRIGASGYVHKLHVHSDLLPAIEAILAGRRFVGIGVDFTDSTKSPCRHEVQFYSDETVFLEGAVRFVAGALKDDGLVIVIATTAHTESLNQRLRAEALDVHGAIEQGTYVPIIAAEALSLFMLHDVFDGARLLRTFRAFIESCIKEAKNDDRRVVVFGEGASVLLSEGRADAAVHIEKTCNDLLETIDADIMCPYPLSAFPRGIDDPAFKGICSEHTAVFSR